MRSHRLSAQRKPISNLASDSPYEDRAVDSAKNAASAQVPPRATNALLFGTSHLGFARMRGPSLHGPSYAPAESDTHSLTFPPRSRIPSAVTSAASPTGR